ncbi:MAG: DUF3370 domain-containing protein [Synechococcales bacterium]|nr:DUF3370 domain-containing protein [Synechococcales bacterium]
MLPLLPLLPIAQALPSVSPATPSLTPAPTQTVPFPQTTPPRWQIPPQDEILPQERLAQQEIILAQEIRMLPGKLDDVPVFNSNSPELVLSEGILLSTFPEDGKLFPAAHLNFTFKGRFDIFSHHISRARHPSELRSLFQGILVYNPTSQLVTIEVLQAASYLTRPDALFVELPTAIDDPTGSVYAGPGSRVVNDILRGRRQGSLPAFLMIPPGESRMLMNLPIPAGVVTPTSNGRSTLMRLQSSGEVYVANMAMFAPRSSNGSERIPTQEDWENFLKAANLAGPRDTPPTPMERSNSDRKIYGRVAGVARGSLWRVQLTDTPNSTQLSIPKKGRAFSYAISTLPRGTFGTGQIQSAPMLVRYSDTAYLANGNYGIHYSFTLPLVNSSKQTSTITLSIDTPLKQDKSRSEVIFLSPPESRVFFRGPIRLRYKDDSGNLQTRFLHLVQRRGQQGVPLLTLALPPGDRREIEVDLLYPPDATPPQLLTIRSLEH